MIKEWSYSRYSTYKACPRKAKYKYVDYYPEPGNIFMHRGTKYHDIAEKYISGELSRLPKQLASFKKLFQTLRKGFADNEVFVESEWGFDSDWKPCTYKGAWLKMKLDCAASDTWSDRMVIIDWKTGKYNGERVADYLEQLSLYALGTFIVCPEINVIEPRIGFLDHGFVYPIADEKIVYTRENDFETLKQLWIDKTYPMLNDTEFICNNSFYSCKYCYFNAKNVDGPQLCNGE